MNLTKSSFVSLLTIIGLALATSCGDSGGSSDPAPTTSAHPTATDIVGTHSAVAGSGVEGTTAVNLDGVKIELKSDYTYTVTSTATDVASPDGSTPPSASGSYTYNESNGQLTLTGSNGQSQTVTLFNDNGKVKVCWTVAASGGKSQKNYCVNTTKS